MAAFSVYAQPQSFKRDFNGENFDGVKYPSFTYLLTIPGLDYVRLVSLCIAWPLFVKLLQPALSMCWGGGGTNASVCRCHSAVTGLGYIMHECIYRSGGLLAGLSVFQLHLATGIWSNTLLHCRNHTQVQLTCNHLSLPGAHACLCTTDPQARSSPRIVILAVNNPHFKHGDLIQQKNTLTPLQLAT